MLTNPLVGTFYRGKAAQALISLLPYGAKVILRPEPVNPYDEFAVAIFVPTQTIGKIPETEILAAIEIFPDVDFDAEVIRQPEVHVGYLPRESARELRTNLNLEAYEEIEAEYLPGERNGMIAYDPANSRLQSAGTLAD